MLFLVLSVLQVVSDQVFLVIVFLNIGLVPVFLWFLYRGQYWEAGPPPPLAKTVLFHCPRRILEPI